MVLRAAALICALAAVVVLAPAQARAQDEVISERAEAATVIVYRDRPVNTAQLLARSNLSHSGLEREGLALIVETRTLDLPAGEAVIRLRGVATGIVPQTATLDGLPAAVIERNTDFDLLSPGALLNRSVGEVVRVVRTNPVTGEQRILPAVVRSGADGTVLEVEGRLEALGCSGLTERIIFDRPPEGLSDQPTLSIRVRAPQAGRHTVTLAYLATGLQWSADYVARMAPDGRSLALTGWITLANFGGSSFENAPVHVVAGNLNRDDSSVQVEPRQILRQSSCWPMDTTTGAVQPYGNAAPGFMPAPAPVAYSEDRLEDVVVVGSRMARDGQLAEQGELGDYKIYSLPEPTDVMARQTKQVRFLEQDRVRFTRLYQARVTAVSDEPVAVSLVLRLQNRRSDGLGLPLPGGGVSLMETQVGRTLLTGQARFEDRGIGLPVDLAFGEAMGVSLRQTGTRTVDPHRRRLIDEVSLVINNDKPEAVEVEIIPSEYRMTGFVIERSSQPSQISDGGYPVFRVRVPAGGTRELTYVFAFDI